MSENVPPFGVDAPPAPPAPTPTPPGTVPTTFATSPATKAALVVSIGIALYLLRGLITGVPPSRETLAAMVETAAWAWAGAFGISRLDTDALRWR